jgi:hypothetical protein
MVIVISAAWEWGAIINPIPDVAAILVCFKNDRRFMLIAINLRVHDK